MAVPPEFTRGVSQGHDFTRLTFRVNAELSKGEQVRTHTHAYALARSRTTSTTLTRFSKTVVHHGKLQLSWRIQSKSCNRNGNDTGEISYLDDTEECFSTHVCENSIQLRRVLRRRVSQMGRWKSARSREKTSYFTERKVFEHRR